MSSAAVVKRCSTTTNMSWALNSLFDAQKTYLLTAPEVSLRQLQGKSMPGGKGILDLLPAKRDVADALHKFASEKGFASNLVMKMETWRASVDAYR